MNNLYRIKIAGVNIVARGFYIQALLAADQELQKMTFGGKKGLQFAGERTCSWRSEAIQRELLNKGASKTMESNHRRGTAVDVLANWDYINLIAPTMKKFGLVNDLAYWNKSTGETRATPAPGFVAWDGGHFNWQSNREAAKFAIVNELKNIPEYKSMNKYEGLILWNTGGDGSFALVKDGKRRRISTERAGLAALAVAATAPLEAERTTIAVTKQIFESIPQGQDF